MTTPTSMPTQPATQPTRLLPRIAQLWLTYIKGQLLMALIVGAAMWVVWAALGLPGAFWLGALAGLMETVPGVGQGIAVIPASAIALIKGSTVVALPNWGFALIVAGVYLALQQVGALWVQPRIVGERLDLHPLVALAAVIVGGLIGNVVGAYLAVPLLVTAREVWRYARGKRSEKRSNFSSNS